MEPTMSGIERDRKASDRLPPLSQPIEWMGIAFRVPDDWQIVRHGLGLDRGSLVLVDRRLQRLQLWWSTVAREPDVERMIDHEREQVEKAESAAQVRALRGFGAWRVLETALPDGAVSTRAARFDPKTSRLLEVVVSTRRDEPTVDLVRALLDAMRVVCRAEAVRSWRAFDVALRMPPDYRLTGTTVNPADVTLRFEAVDPEDGSELGVSMSLRRMSMLADWYAGNAEALIRRDLPKVEFESFEPVEHAGHPALRAAGLLPAPPLRRLLGKRRSVRATAWTCEPENAFYLLTHTSPSDHGASSLDFGVDCCAAKTP